MGKRHKSDQQRQHRFGGHRPASASAIDRRKQEVLTRHTPSVAQSIAEAIVLKDGDLYFLCDREGAVPLEEGHGFGLYYHDCRYLDGYELRLGDRRVNTLLATTQGSYKGLFHMTNPRLAKEPPVAGESLGLEWTRLVKDEEKSLFESIVLRNHATTPVTVPLSLELRARFEDVFAIRGLLDERPGACEAPAWQGDRLRFRYAGGDGLHRVLSVQFSPAPDRVEGATAHFDLVLEPQGEVSILVTLTVAESPEPGAEPATDHHGADPAAIERRLASASDRWIEHHTRVSSDNALLNRIVESSLMDLQALRSAINGQSYFTAGVPWFTTLFGRDSLVTAMQTLAYDPDIAASTLRLLAQLQGQHVDVYRDEQPGKILHEFRQGELAHMEAIPHTPYYGSVDATPLFLVLLTLHARWSGSLALFRELAPAVEGCLGWIDRYGDTDGDGFVDYDSTVDHGLINQGWKDAGDSIVDADGSLAEPPIALAEVQAYVYMAKLGIADLFARAGDPGRAERLRAEAAALKARFNEAYWMEEAGFYAMALQQGGRLVRSIGSNAGHGLWCGIVDADKAGRVRDRLLADDMFSGWGVRTLAASERAYNPIGYHLGTVWPHDNALIAAGMKRYGFDQEAERIFDGIFAAAAEFPDYHLPEVFAGHPRAAYGHPVRYPVACHPQAWAAGSLLHLLQVLLGFQPNGYDGVLRVVRPRLPDLVDWLELHHIRVGDARVDLRFVRGPEGVTVETLRLEGDLCIEVETEDDHGHR